MFIFRFAIAVTLLALAASSPARAEEYAVQVIASGLSRPTGITVSRWGDVVFTQLPTPGVPGSMGGRNTVSVLNHATGLITTLAVGEPEPTNLAISRRGDLYWTCKSAGVILTLPWGASAPALVVGGRNKPTGIAVDPRPSRHGRLYFTEVPTPGMPGGANGVFALDGAGIHVLSMGEPEPVDVAVDRAGNLYWTCRTAGVILTLRRGATDPTLLLSGLNRPTGIAVGRGGELFFTEVPEPGVPGGANKIWRYDQHRRKKSVVHAGDPEPTDVAVGRDGSVYWTCTSAGVIVRATPRRAGRH